MMYNTQISRLHFVVMFDRSRLTPEQNRAINVLEDNFPQWVNSIQNEPLTLERICTQNIKIFTDLSVTTSSLPRGELWSWNQSRARQTIESLFGNITVCFYKLSTRKTPRATEKAPLVKLWIFNITIPILGAKDKYLNFLWCEKGLENTEPHSNNRLDNFVYTRPSPSQQMHPAHQHQYPQFWNT